MGTKTRLFCDICLTSPPREKLSILKIQGAVDMDICQNCKDGFLRFLGLLSIPYSYYRSTKYVRSILDILPGGTNV